MAEYEQLGSDRLFALDGEGRLNGVTSHFASLANQSAHALEGLCFAQMFELGSAQTELLDGLSRRQPFSDLVMPIKVGRELRYWSLNARPVEGGQDGVAFRGIVTDVTAKKEAEARVSRLAHFDALTDLPNRLTFEEEAPAHIERATPANRCGLIFLDIDHFKAANDEHGHRFGDAVLTHVAARLVKVVGDDAVVARFGGDEFAVLLRNGVTQARLSAVAQAIVDAMAVPIQKEGLTLNVSVSVGFAMAPDDAASLPDLLHYADLALYASKEAGRNRWTAFEDDMNASARLRRTLVGEMEDALDRGEFSLAYQPLFDARKLQVKGFEALIRWNSASRGFVSPAEFIPLAEESGFIGKLGEWVIRTATAQVARWPEPITVAVNVSPVQLRTDGLEHIVADALRRARLQPSRLELEITEGVLLHENRRTRALLERLRAIGIRFSLDDFGTGFSSLGYLQKFAFHKIKIDRSFVNELQSDGNGRAIVKAVITLARDMGMLTVAEGIELPGQLAALQALGCDQIQGYLTGKPMSGEDATALLLPAEAARVRGV